MRTALLAAVGPRPADPAGVGEGGGDEPAQRRRRVVAAGPRRAAASPPTSPSTGSTRLVDNLLDMSRLQAGALSVVSRPIALDEVVPLALDDLGAAGRRVVASTCRTTSRMVLADPGLLERVIANLVGNALRYSPSASRPASRAAASGDRVELRVIDRGPGIPAAELDRVFAPFQRLGDTDNTTGVGLGSRAVPRPGRGDGRAPDARRRRRAVGSPWCCPCPLHRRRARRREPRSGQGASGEGRQRRPRRSAVHDPGAGRRRRAADPARPRHQPAGRRYEVFTAGTGTEALLTAAAHPPDLVILDLGLPDMDGVEVIRGLRGWSTAPDRHPLRPHRQRRQGRAPWTPAPTTTSPSPSAWTS